MKCYKQWKRQTLNTMLRIGRENNIKWGSFLSVDRLWFSWSFSPKKMDMIIRSQHCNDCNLDLGTGKTQGCVCQTINLVCCGNFWKQTHKLLDPDNVCVANSLKFSCVNPHPQSVNLKLKFLWVQNKFLFWLRPSNQVTCFLGQTQIWSKDRHAVILGSSKVEVRVLRLVQKNVYSFFNTELVRIEWS